MSDILDAAVAALSEKLGGADIGGTVKFVIEGAGAVMIDGGNTYIGDEPADVTLSADSDTFQGILSGDTNPTGAFMSGKLKVDGDMGMAMKLASAMA
jgi:putative sterol carrier protein